VGKVSDSGAAPSYLPIETSRPSPEDQVRFITSIERVLAEGSFVATYKYALLVALVELAIERGDESSRELVLPIHDIAEKFAELYWRQAVPYEADGSSGRGLVLHQNQGTQAGAISRLVEFRNSLPGKRSTLAEARRTPEWRKLVTRMRALLKSMPLWRLQRIGHEDIRFLYDAGPGAANITLLPGVACHLRERASLIRRLAETEWLRFVLSLEQNRPMLGRAVGLSQFLFGSSRAALSIKVSRPLREVQDGRCFYCRRGLRATADVDHFIPWSRYPRDLAHNLVLAHGACNSHKSDWLGGEAYLARWVEFITDHDADLQQLGADAGLPVDRATSVAVAEWSYGHAERVQAEVWLGGTDYGHLSAGWRGLLEQVPKLA
jgi:5-methylcytosine-specific restriction endonuclease McrA